MALYHDAYLFQEHRFVAELVHLIRDHKSDEELFDTIRKGALQRHREKLQVQALAERYGGWDMEGIASLIGTADRENKQSVAAALSIILYDCLLPQTNSGFGLGERWLDMDAILTGFGWSAAPRRLLVHGEAFSALARYITGPTAAADLGRMALAYMQPRFMPFACESIGWIGTSMIGLLEQRLSANRRSVEGIALPMGVGVDVARQTVDRELTILQLARTTDSGLCMIIAG
jgi:hypothetical protein